MEREDLDQIPWSQLAVEADDGVDRRWYGVGIAVGLVIVAVLGFRLLSGNGGQPLPEPAVSPSDSAATSSTSSSPSQVPPPPIAGISESELRAGNDTASLAAITVAEWFVTDLKTVDGSPESAASLRRLSADAIADHPLPHDAAGAGSTFVEWARAFDADVTESGSATVAVAYRMIREEGGVYTRDVVRALELTLAKVDEHWIVASWPTEIDPP